METNATAYNIGEFLKRIRLDKNKKLREFASDIKYSHGHVSSIENGKKGVPKQDFIEKYLNKISDSSEEYNGYVDSINAISDGQINIKKKEITDESQLNKNILNNQKATLSKDFLNSLNRMAIPFEFNYEINDKIKMQPFNVQINDLIFHLNDTLNRKFYKNIEITEVDRKNIEILIDSYFENKLNIQKTIRNQLAHGTLKIDDLNTINKDIEDKL
ncbi:helix-turn-helix domain-containing protein [Staphylococcus pasteuri]|uniref:helix-turn-helix domain-containing protein n=1 Tax=Staphylococcus pasteuri TaxID=45972 RepID=UPI002DBE1A2B|nr:helix-turn-helix transcriptional regulator [Staphylococcus pasteuri]MEB7435242.1 helix-turn-helix domain-containing protein [Staphylococcus pasteuri]